LYLFLSSHITFLAEYRKSDLGMGFGMQSLSDVGGILVVMVSMATWRSACKAYCLLHSISFPGYEGY